MKRPRLSAFTGLVSLLTFGSGCSNDGSTPEATPVVRTTPDYATASPSVKEPKHPILSPFYTTMKWGNLQYPLVSVADRMTTLNMQEATNVRNVSEYVINKDKQLGLVKYDSFPEEQIDFQRVQVIMKIGRDEYIITVANMDETKNSDEEYGNYDVLFLTIRPNASKKNNDIIEFRDTGLDGNVNFMESTNKISLFGHKLTADTRFSHDVDFRLENREIAQTLYTTALDRIIAFYERNK